MTSGHEHAAIYATVAGVITRGDLRGKRGPETLNYLSNGKVIDAAIAAAEGTIGKITVVQRVLIYHTSLSIDALVRVRRITSAANVPTSTASCTSQTSPAFGPFCQVSCRLRVLRSLMSIGRWCRSCSRRRDRLQLPAAASGNGVASRYPPRPSPKLDLLDVATYAPA